MRALTRISFAFLLAAAVLPARAQDKVDRLDMKGHAAFDAQDYDLAIKYWSAVLQIDPNDSTAWFNRATAYTFKQDIENAIADYSQALRIYPTDPQARLFRGELYQVRWATAVAKGNPGSDDMDKAIADYTELVRVKPDASAYFTRAAAYRETKQYDKAIADYTDAIRLDVPTNIQGYEYRAAVYIAEGKRDKAIDDYSQMIRIQPNGETPYALRGEEYFENGDYDKAIADANDAIRLNPGFADAIALRGNSYSAKGMYDKAIADFDSLIASNPDYAEGFNAEAWLFATCPKAEIRNGPKAMELARKACDLTQWKDDGFLDTLAAAEAETGRWDDAVKHQKQALEISKANKEDDWRIKDYASRLPLYQQKQPYRDVKQPSQ